MSALSDEIDHNFAAFSAKWPTEVDANRQALLSHPAFRSSYRHITAIQSLKANVIVPDVSLAASSFFLEAQNDALLSHVQASLGSWRSALQSLRSMIEASLSCYFYMDHPVELQRWREGRFRIGFSEMHEYFQAHPRFDGLDSNVFGLSLVKAEYAELSKAVHGSAVNFWMTADTATISLWNSKKERAGMWGTRQRRAVQAVCLIGITLFADALAGAQRPGTRETLGLLFGAATKQQIRKCLKVNLS